MKKIFLLTIFTLHLISDPIFIDENYNKDLKILRSLDIEDSFILDEISLELKNRIDNQSKYFFKSLKKGDVFVPILRKMLIEEGIPEVFLYMAMAESNFSLTALSSARANGLWQFMPLTAKSFGLKINSFVDERRDPILSTKSAIKYLKYLHSIFGKWYLVALAYNCGEGRIMRAIKKADGDKLTLLVDKKAKYIPRESRLYIRRIISLSQMAQNRDFLTHNGMEFFLNRGSSKTLKKVYLWGDTSLKDMAISLSVDVKKLHIYNQHIKKINKKPRNGRYHIYVPYQNFERVNYNFNRSKLDKNFIIHTVSMGDTIGDIMKKYDVSFSQIQDMNDLKGEFLPINFKLIIPIKNVLQKEDKIKKREPTLREFLKQRTNS